MTDDINTPQPPEVNPPDGNSDQQPENTGQVPMVALSMEEFETLQKELEQARAKASEYSDGWQRERADFTNYKKRIERDNAQVYQNALANVLKKYLVILDDLDRALRNRPAGTGSPSNGSDQPAQAASGLELAWVDGIELIYRKLLASLENEGIRRMEAEKEFFDPTRHEAIMQEDSPDHQSGQIIEVIQQGYVLGDRVIRPALVRVAR
jgi:molecular chaperone GrpE